MSGSPLSGTAVLAYGIGAGLVFIPLVGIPIRFAFLGVAPVLVYAGAFLLGTGMGALFAAVARKTRN